MTPQILEWLRQNAPAAKSVLEVGSRDVNGSARDVFPDASYWGIDIEDGPGVDQVANAHSYISKRQHDLVLCLEMLEHDNKPWQTIEAARANLQRGGHLIISVPTNGFPEHKYPIDLCRFLPDAFVFWFFAGMEGIRVDKISDSGGLPGLIGIARKP
jgi:hypothetical protein